MASGHVNRIKRPDTWLHRPMMQNVKKVLAIPEPSTHGTKRTSDDVRFLVANGGKADIPGKGHFGSDWRQHLYQISGVRSRSCAVSRFPWAQRDDTILRVI